jgi:hypothetical protein
MTYGTQPMAKSNKATVLQRVNDVGRLILAGAEFAEIRQYASDQGWQVSQRQIRRYMERCYKRLAQATERNQSELLGRHLMQRRAIYARSLKSNDLRTALQVLRDEAALEGLYPDARLGARHQLVGPTSSPLRRVELVAQTLAAEAKEDKQQLALLKTATPIRYYQFPSTMMPTMGLHVATLLYVQEQLEQIATYFHAAWRADEQDIEQAAVDDQEPTDEWFPWWEIALVAAYRLKIGREAWYDFTSKHGLDGDYLIAGNYQGMMLEMVEEPIINRAPTADEIVTVVESLGATVTHVQTAGDLAKSWQDYYEQLVQE